jgi:dTDP-4-dehydrorhamnose reductase
MEWIINSEKTTHEINGWTNHFWNGITCLEYCNIILQIMNEHLFWTGIKHICSPNTVSKYELASYIIDIFDLNIKINKLECNETINKTLKSNYENIFHIKSLFEQIKDLKKYNL